MAAKRGIVAGGGQTQRLARYIPFGRAMELIMFGERIPADEALSIGLVNRVVEKDALLDTAMDWAARLCKNGPLAPFARDWAEERAPVTTAKMPKVRVPFLLPSSLATHVLYDAYCSYKCMKWATYSLRQ